MYKRITFDLYSIAARNNEESNFCLSTILGSSNYFLMTLLLVAKTKLKLTKTLLSDGEIRVLLTICSTNYRVSASIHFLQSPLVYNLT